MKISLNKQISSSRLPNCLPKFIHKEVIPEQVADIIIRKDKKSIYSIVYLPMDYHRQNPGYLAYVLDEVAKENKKWDSVCKIIVILLV
jgi:hypothetical protein